MRVIFDITPFESKHFIPKFKVMKRIRVVAAIINYKGRIGIKDEK